jgi:WD40 repeat protein
MRSCLLIALLLLGTLTSRSQTPELVLPIGHTAEITKVLVTPDKRFLLTASKDGTAKIWNYKTGRLRHNLALHTGAITDMAISNAGDFVLLGSEDASYSKWEIASGELLAHIPTKVRIKKIWLLPGDSLCLLQGNYSVVVAPTDTEDEEVYLHQDNSDPIDLCEMSPDRSIVAYTQKRSSYVYFYKTDGEGIGVAQQLKLDSTFYDLLFLKPVSIQFAGNKELLVRFENYYCAVYATDGRQLHRINGSVTDAVTSSNGRYTAYARYYHDTLVVLDMKTRQPAFLLKRSEFSGTLCGFGQGDTTLLLQYNGTLNERGFGGQLHNRAEVGLSRRFLSYLPDEQLFITQLKQNRKYGTVDLWKNGTVPVKTFEGKVEQLTWTRLSSDGQYLLEQRISYAGYWKLAKGKSIRFPDDSIGGSTVLKLHLTAEPHLVVIQYDSSFVLYDLEQEQARYRQRYTNGADFVLSPAKTRVVTSAYLSPGEICIWDVATGTPIRKFTTPYRLSTIAIDPGNRLLAGVAERRNRDTVEVRDLETGKRLAAYDRNYVSVMEFSADGQYLFFNTGGTEQLQIEWLPLWEQFSPEDSLNYPGDGYYHASNGRFSANFRLEQAPGTSIIYFSEPDPEASQQQVLAYKYRTDQVLQRFSYKDYHWILCLLPAQQKLVTATETEVLFWDMKTAKTARIFPLPPGFKAVSWQEETGTLLVSSNDRVGVITLNGKKPTYYLSTFNSGDYIVFRDDRYYLVTPEAARWLTWRSGKQLYDFDQWDLQFNRPDKILEVLDRPGTPLVQAYHKAYLKRLKKTGVTEKMFRPGLQVPVVTLQHDWEEGSTTDSGQTHLQVTCTNPDPLGAITAVHVTVNDVPVYGSSGFIPEKPAAVLQLQLPLALTPGRNKLKVSCVNSNGVESVRESVTRVYQPATPLPETVYFVGIGINRFADSRQNLAWCVKDIQDLVTQLRKKYGNALVVDTLLDKQVTREQFLAVTEKLKKSRVQDKVIIAYSGHGVLSDSFDYYLSAFNMDFKQPANGGIPYELLEELLEQIPARKKLLLLDACHSGEVDKEELITITKTNEQLRQQGVVIHRGSEEEGGTQVVNQRVGLENSFELMQNLFVRVGRGTGATIISAAGGVQLAQERGEFQNGVFTFSILEALRQFKTLTVSGLKSYVSARVVALTNGLQHPTAREELWDADWELW